MTRKDFQLIADVLKASSTSPMNRCVIKELAVSFASELAKTNPRFNAQRFVKACTESNKKHKVLKLKNRFSVGFTDEQFQMIEDKKREEVLAGRVWTSRADIVRRMLFEACLEK